MIYCFGDSHIDFFKYFSGGFERHWTGSLIAYNLENKIDVIDGIMRKLEINKSTDILLFSFGEIDCRLHILQQTKKQNKTVDEIINEVVKRYLTFLKLYEEKGFKIIIWAPIPALPDSEMHKDFLYTGTHIKRNKNVEKFTKCLQLYNFYPVLSVYNDLTENYKTRDGYHNGIHLNKEAVPFATVQFIEAGLM